MATSAATLVEENSGARVLIVDDDEELCELMTLRLGSHGYGVSSVHTAEQALSAVLSERPDAVILDLRLGADDGLNVLVELLSHNTLPFSGS